MTTNFQKSQLKRNLKVKSSDSWSFSKLNYLIFTFGLISIFIGYIVMITGEVNSFQSLTVAPVFLFFGYIILIPVSLLIEKRKN
tara:strand:- start:65 stop:316 length:252 start_codon:yes stop_codon:yes gene_type:complete